MNGKVHGYGGKMTLGERLYLGEIFRGLGITIRHVIRNLLHTGDLPTVQYPEERRAYSERFRGRHRLMKREDGTPRCVACMMCSTACPADCIHIVAEEHPDPAIEKAPASFEIDLLRCVYCGLCEEACPCDAIRMDTGIYDLAADSREKFWVDKDFLLNNTTDGTR
ncbi:MAG: NADH-quinone oxidoreductase subunit I [bacterium]|nr:NADH-quinone oxidoreductase subunit I [bacterium]